jgi:hypothetical protein
MVTDRQRMVNGIRRWDEEKNTEAETLETERL